jgi:hypothetical protein
MSWPIGARVLNSKCNSDIFAISGNVSIESFWPEDFGFEITLMFVLCVCA